MAVNKVNQERLVVRAYYYVLLLVDRSQSMLWPFLIDQNNKNKDNTEDYKNAIRKLQKEISGAHEKALVALRGSRVCKDRYMIVYQYAFNDRLKIINFPKELSPFEGGDEVELLTEENYLPESTTALYDVIYEALDIVEKKYLRPVREKEKRIDRVIIGVITDGEDTVYVDRPDERTKKIEKINELLVNLRGNKSGYRHLYASVLIGLTSGSFTKERLQQVRNEIGFDEAISIDQTDENAIRQAFKVASTYPSEM